MSEEHPPTDQSPGPDGLESVGDLSQSGSGAAVIAATPPVRKRFSIDPFGLRLLIISWCLWLLVSWSITLYIGAVIHAVRWVIFSAVFGLMAVWPALRLSQQLPWYHRYGKRGSGTLPVGHHGDSTKASSPTRVLATLLDWVCLIAVLQVVVWPLMVVGRWSVKQTLWLDLAVMSWSLLAGALVGIGRVLPGGWIRLGAMGLCMLLLVGEPAWMALSGYGFSGYGIHDQTWQMRISPLQALWDLTTTKQSYSPSRWIPAILSTAAAAVLAWLVLAVIAWWTRESKNH